MKKRMGPAILDDRLETLAFGVCNTDGVEGLSWAEVEQCTVGYNSTFMVGHNKKFSLSWDLNTQLPAQSRPVNLIFNTLVVAYPNAHINTLNFLNFLGIISHPSNF